MCQNPVFQPHKYVVLNYFIYIRFMGIRIFLMASLLSVVCGTLNGQENSFKEVAPTYKLSKLNLDITNKRLIIDKVQLDNEGYYWITTNNGLWVYNGVTSTQYLNGSEKFPMLKNSISSNFFGLIQDKTGDLLTSIYGKNIFLRYDPIHRKLKEIYSFKKAMLFEESIFSVDENNELYYITKDIDSKEVTLFKATSERTKKGLFALPKIEGKDDKVISLHLFRNKIFILTDTYIYFLDKAGNLLKKEPLTSQWASWPFAYNDENNFYILNELTGQMMIWDFQKNELKPYFLFPNTFHSTYSVFLIHKETLVCYNGDGLYVYNLKNRTYQKIFSNIDPSSSKANKEASRIDINSISIDHAGGFLLTENKNIYHLTETKKSAIDLKKPIVGLANQPSTRGFTEDASGSIYVTYYDAGIAKKSKDAQQFEVCNIPKNPNIRLESTFSIAAYNAKLIWNNTLLDLKNNQIEALSTNRQYGHTTQYLKGDSLWLYPWWGDNLEVYDLARKTSKVYNINTKNCPQVRFNVLNAITPDESGKHFWVASLNGISLISKQGVLIENYNTDLLNSNQDNGITDLFYEKPFLWYGGSNGLGTFNTETKEVTLYEFPDSQNWKELSNRKVFFIQPLNKDEFYLGTDYGLILFNKKTKKYFELKRNQQLSVKEFNRNSNFESSKNEFYVGTTDGVYSFFPEELEWDIDNEEDKNIRINLVSVFNDSGGYRHLFEDMNQTNTLTLAPNDVSIEVYYDALQEEKEVLYSHRIIGGNENWSDYSNERKLNLLGIAPGEYTLELRTSNSPHNIKILHIYKAQYWYLRWYSQLVFIIILVMLITLLINYRYRLRLQKERELAGLRNKISSDLHDDVGSILTAVAMQSEILGNKEKAYESEKLKRIGSLSREAMSRMRDTVWSIDSKKDNMGSLLSRMKDFTSDIFQDNERLSFHFVKGKETKTEQPLNPIVRQNVYLIFKEAIANCLKHCNGNKVEIVFKCSKSELYLEIADNGTTAADMKTSGLGLTNMDLRAKKINGDLKIATESGFKIVLQVPLL